MVIKSLGIHFPSKWKWYFGKKPFTHCCRHMKGRKKRESGTKLMVKKKKKKKDERLGEWEIQRKINLALLLFLSFYGTYTISQLSFHPTAPPFKWPRVMLVIISLSLFYSRARFQLHQIQRLRVSGLNAAATTAKERHTTESWRGGAEQRDANEGRG